MIIYNILLYALIPFILLRLWLRGIKAPSYRKRWLERFAFFERPPSLNTKKVIWVHAVSVGEVLAAKPLIEKLLDQSNCALVVTTTTPTGSDQVRRLFENNVFHVYAPYDLYGVVNRFLKKIKPDVALIIETEIWPNMITLCNKKNIPTILVNGRLSEKSLLRYKKFDRFSSAIINKITTICAQSSDDEKRFASLNARLTVVTGSIKSDIDVNKQNADDVAQLSQYLFGDKKKTILIAASTHKGEDEIVLEAYRKIKNIHNDVFLVLVPRHPERFDEVNALCLQKGFLVQRKSHENSLDVNTDVLLADTMGELFLLYGLADIAIMGGTFVECGGHNYLEPVAWGLPIVSGRSDYNFSLIAKELMELGVLSQVDDTDSLVVELREILDDENKRIEKSIAAKNYIANKRGAIEKVSSIIAPFIAENKQP